jgi:hypothetical protein
MEETRVYRRRPKAPKRLVGDARKRLDMVARYGRTDPAKFVFSDEMAIDTNDHGNIGQWVLPGQLPDPRRFEQYAPKVMVWGAVGVGYRKLVILPKFMSDGRTFFRLNAEEYKRRCLQVVVPYVKSAGKIFQHDGARCHIAEHCKRYLASKGVTVVEPWAPRSCDLNPIEHVWSLLKRRVAARNPSGEDELRSVVLEEFNAIPQATIDSIVGGWTSACRRCVEKRGM